MPNKTFTRCLAVLACLGILALSTTGFGAAKSTTRLSFYQVLKQPALLMSSVVPVLTRPESRHGGRQDRRLLRPASGRRTTSRSRGPAPATDRQIIGGRRRGRGMVAPGTSGPHALPNGRARD